ncbi:MAG TPA: pyrroline-5-carboxylate reductase [Burkholderiales bacterium]
MGVNKTRTPRRAARVRKPGRAGKARASGPRRRPLVGFIGAGNMARSLAGGLIANGWPAGRIIFADPDTSQRDAVKRRFGAKSCALNAEVAARTQVLVLAVKPQVMRAVATEIAPAVRRQRPLVISIAAGIRIADLEHWLEAKIPIVRAMPNTPALVGAGAAGLYANALASRRMRATAETILRSTGVTAWVENERDLDVVTALSGSGPAYFLLVMEALEQAAIAEGLNRDAARLLTLETAYGAAKMALEGAEEPSLLRARVTSPGGTTERAVDILTRGGVTSLFAQAVHGATKRARELAEMFGRNA